VRVRWQEAPDWGELRRGRSREEKKKGGDQRKGQVKKQQRQKRRECSRKERGEEEWEGRSRKMKNGYDISGSRSEDSG